ncbi:hypothetical protein [Nocardia sp. NPDC058497]|uniref:hypothetical protein n=1 Tax=Nocardia sp. NPDC058497 TaxID=3346529 RepID=UPI003661C211
MPDTTGKNEGDTWTVPRAGGGTTTYTIPEGNGNQTVDVTDTLPDGTTSTARIVSNSEGGYQKWGQNEFGGSYYIDKPTADANPYGQNFVPGSDTSGAPDSEFGATPDWRQTGTPTYDEAGNRTGMNIGIRNEQGLYDNVHVDTEGTRTMSATTRAPDGSLNTTYTGQIDADGRGWMLDSNGKPAETYLDDRGNRVIVSQTPDGPVEVTDLGNGMSRTTSPGRETVVVTHAPGTNGSIAADGLVDGNTFTRYTDGTTVITVNKPTTLANGDQLLPGDVIVKNPDGSIDVQSQSEIDRTAVDSQVSYWAGVGRVFKDSVTDTAAMVGIGGPGFRETWQGIGSLVGLGPEGGPGVGEAWKEMGKETVAWDDWARGDSAYALGKVAANVATLGLGGFSKVGKAGGLGDGVDVGDIPDPDAHGLDTSAIDTSAIDIEGPDPALADLPSGVSGLDRAPGTEVDGVPAPRSDSETGLGTAAIDSTPGDNVATGTSGLGDWNKPGADADLRTSPYSETPSYDKPGMDAADRSSIGDFGHPPGTPEYAHASAPNTHHAPGANTNTPVQPPTAHGSSSTAGGSSSPGNTSVGGPNSTVGQPNNAPLASNNVVGQPPAGPDNPAPHRTSDTNSPLDPEFVNTSINRLDGRFGGEGHAPGRHLYPDDVTLQARLGDPIRDGNGGLRTYGPNSPNYPGLLRSENNIDPLTGTVVDGDHGGTPRVGAFATRFDNAEDMVLADLYARQQISQAGLGRSREPVEIPLADIVGPNGHQRFTGFYRNPQNPNEFLPVDFENGTITAVYDKLPDGSYGLTTMYPNPAKGRHP